MSLFKQNINSFLSEAASKSPTPGGGSIAALAAALGASMGSMVANLTMGPKYESLLPEMESCIAEMKKLMDACENIMFQDIQAFQSYMGALKLPKETEEEKQLRTQTLQEATIKSTEVPLALMRLCNQGLDQLEAIVNDANKNVISDLGIGAILMEASAQSAYLTVRMNLPVIKDEQIKKDLEREGELLSKETLRKKDGIQEMVLRIMG